jgi:hypothetical protein
MMTPASCILSFTCSSYTIGLIGYVQKDEVWAKMSRGYAASEKDEGGAKMGDFDLLAKEKEIPNVAFTGRRRGQRCRWVAMNIL